MPTTLICILLYSLAQGTQPPRESEAPGSSQLQHKPTTTVDTSDKQDYSGFYGNAALLLGSLVTVLFTIGTVVTQLTSKHAAESLDLAQRDFTLRIAWVLAAASIVLLLALAGLSAHHIGYRLLALTVVTATLIALSAAIPRFLTYIDSTRFRTQLIQNVHIGLSDTQETSHRRAKAERTASHSFHLLLRIGRQYLAEGNPAFSDYLNFSAMISKSSWRRNFPRKLARRMLAVLSNLLLECAGRHDTEGLRTLTLELHQCAKALINKGDGRFIRLFATSLMREPTLTLLVGLKNSLAIITTTQLAADLFSLSLPGKADRRPLQKQLMTFLETGGPAAFVAARLGLSLEASLFYGVPARCALDLANCHSLSSDYRRTQLALYLDRIMQDLYGTFLENDTEIAKAALESWTLTINALFTAGFYKEVADGITFASNACRSFVGKGRSPEIVTALARVVLGAERRWRAELNNGTLSASLDALYTNKVSRSFMSILNLWLENPSLQLEGIIPGDFCGVATTLTNQNCAQELERLFAVVKSRYKPELALSLFHRPTFAALASALCVTAKQSGESGTCARSIAAWISTVLCSTLKLSTESSSYHSSIGDSTSTLTQLIKAMVEAQNWELLSETITLLDGHLSAYANLDHLSSYPLMLLIVSVAPYVLAGELEGNIVPLKVRKWLPQAPQHQRNRIVSALKDLLLGNESMSAASLEQRIISLT